jgi:hypothetical protein
MRFQRMPNRFEKLLESSRIFYSSRCKRFQRVVEAFERFQRLLFITFWKVLEDSPSFQTLPTRFWKIPKSSKRLQGILHHVQEGFRQCSNRF